MNVKNWFYVIILFLLIFVSFNFITFFHWSKQNVNIKRKLYISNIFKKSLKVGDFKIIYDSNLYFTHLKGININNSLELSNINYYPSYYSLNQVHSITFPLNFSNETIYQFLTKLYQENQALFHEKVHVHLCLYKISPPTKNFLLQISQDYFK